MMSRRQVRRGLAVAAGWGLLGAVLAGCGSVAASTPAGTGATVAAGAVPAVGSQVGCASVNQATMVTISRLAHLVLPRTNAPLEATSRQRALVRALFRDFCDAVTHPEAASAVMHCPADFGNDYAGVFYDGNRVLASFTYAASGCQRVGIIVGRTTQSTLLAGRAAAAAPHLASDWSAVLGAAKPAVLSSPAAQVDPGGPNTLSSPAAQVNPGGPNKPA
jgi:hypothetical protein